jgi:hypothetical protein
MKRSVEILGAAMEMKVDKLRWGFANALYQEVLAPILKEWKLYMKWGMGGVSFYDASGEEVEENDPRIRLTLKDIESACHRYQFNPDSRCGDLWDIVSWLKGEATNDKQELVDYDGPYITNPSAAEKKQQFKDLKKGDYIYMVNYENGDIEKVVLADVIVNGGLTRLVPIKDFRQDSYYEPFDVGTYRYREENMFMCPKAAEKSLDRLFHRLSAHYNFSFKPEPWEIMGQLLA